MSYRSLHLLQQPLSLKCIRQLLIFFKQKNHHPVRRCNINAHFCRSLLKIHIAGNTRIIQPFLQEIIPLPSFISLRIFLDTVRNENLGHTPHNISVAVHLLPVSGDAHDSHHIFIHHQRQIDPFFRHGIFHFPRDIKLRQMILYNASCPLMQIADSGSVGTCYDISPLIHKIDVCSYFPSDFLHDFLCRLSGNVHAVPPFFS